MLINISISSHLPIYLHFSINLSWICTKLAVLMGLDLPLTLSFKMSMSMPMSIFQNKKVNANTNTNFSWIARINVNANVNTSKKVNVNECFNSIAHVCCKYWFMIEIILLFWCIFFQTFCGCHVLRQQHNALSTRGSRLFLALSLQHWRPKIMHPSNHDDAHSLGQHVCQCSSQRRGEKERFSKVAACCNDWYRHHQYS